jgi:N-acetylglucosaminyldiphosphoundecaprenol N-acetyl-beta-D-mannosaminyltransferase
MDDLIKRNNGRIFILGCPIDNISLSEFIDIIEDLIKSKSISKCVAINADKIVKIKKDPFLRRFIFSSYLNIIDGQSLVWVGRLFGHKIKERFGGIDIINALMSVAYDKGYKVYFLGANENVVSDLVKIFKNIYKNLKIAGWRNGYWAQDEEKKVVENIKKASPDILFIAISSPKREIFMDKYLKEMGVPFVMGVGGAFDVLVGKTKRAPKWIQRIGFEWFFRFAQEPRRLWKRYLIGNFNFVWLVTLEFIRLLFKKIKAKSHY